MRRFDVSEFRFNQSLKCQSSVSVAVARFAIAVRTVFSEGKVMSCESNRGLSKKEVFPMPFKELDKCAPTSDLDIWELRFEVMKSPFQPP